MNCKEYVLSELCEVQIGRTPPRKEMEWFNPECDGIKWVSIKDLGNCNKYISDTSETISPAGQKKFNIPVVEKGTVLLSFKLTVGRVAIAQDTMLTNEAIAQLPIKRCDLLDRDFLYYYLVNYKWSQLGNTSSIATAINSKIIRDMRISIPPIEIQKKIVSIISAIDEKLDLVENANNRIMEQVLALYQHIFVETSVERNICRADEFFDIAIGKTPPRKEMEWFSTDSKDIRWVSISDMGNSGLYISDSSEYLTPEAVKKFNVVVIPDNTVLLSFKLTVGRLAITDGEMTTNEAIAHFKTDDPYINPYLYCYLRKFNYRSLGSTSSIATAINSKIVKGMPFIIPDPEELDCFNEYALPAFSMIKANQEEIRSMQILRNTLLPKLMNGELDISEANL